MKEETILEKAIDKAKKNGWNPESWPEEDAKFEVNCCLSAIDLIFGHDFAKAFWGEDTKECVECNRLPEQRFTRDMIGSKYTEKCEDERHSYRNIDNWKTHLQTMVLEENPIKYLEKFLTN